MTRTNAVPRGPKGPTTAASFEKSRGLVRYRDRFFPRFGELRQQAVNLGKIELVAQSRPTKDLRASLTGSGMQ